MAAVLIDSNVLLDLITEDRQWFAWSYTTITDAAEHSRLVINPIVYAEISVRYSSIEDLNAAIPTTMVDREPIPYEAAYLAGKAFSIYRKRGGKKRSTLPDFFFIGAHASVAGYTLLTRDAIRYRTYFPRLALIAPE
jgi:predicted nucleic acid-binding protein